LHRIKVNASQIAVATAGAAQSEDRSAEQKTTFFDSIDPMQTLVRRSVKLSVNDWLGTQRQHSLRASKGLLAFRATAYGYRRPIEEAPAVGEVGTIDSPVRSAGGFVQRVGALLSIG
jgi:hypothetical protein